MNMHITEICYVVPVSDIVVNFHLYCILSVISCCWYMLIVIEFERIV